MKLNFEISKHNITFNDEVIEVYNKISTEDKIAIISTAIGESIKFGPVPSKAAFEATVGALICYKYSNIEVEDLGDKSILYAYDAFMASGFLPRLIEEIDKKDYTSLLQFADATFETAITYYNSGMSMLETALQLGVANNLNEEE